MCFTVNSSCLQPIVADRDIIVYKLSDYNWDGIKSLFSKRFIPKFRTDYVYFKNKLAIVHDVFSGSYSRGDDISRGLHSYMTKKTAKSNRERGQRLGKFIIPKGSLYMVNRSDEEVISNQLIFKGYLFIMPRLKRRWWR